MAARFALLKPFHGVDLADNLLLLRARTRLYGFQYNNRAPPPKAGRGRPVTQFNVRPNIVAKEKASNQCMIVAESLVCPTWNAAQ
jgi:hypothetical protein